jgi:hypothetical protein
LTSIIAHEAHKRTKLKNKTKWEMVVNDLFNHEAFKGFLPVQADSIARKFKRLKKEFEDKYITYENENMNVELDTDRMNEIDELLYTIRKDEIADLTDENGNVIMKPRRLSKPNPMREILADGSSSACFAETSNNLTNNCLSRENIARYGPRCASFDALT